VPKNRGRKRTPVAEGPAELERLTARRLGRYALSLRRGPATQGDSFPSSGAWRLEAWDAEGTGMKGRSKDSTRTLAERILAGHSAETRGHAEPSGPGGGRSFKIDQLVLARAPHEGLAAARQAGVRASAVELSLAYPPQCISWGAGPFPGHAPGTEPEPSRAIPTGFVVAQPGAGFAPLVHLERFAAPGRIAVVDDQRLALLGAVGMLTLVVPSDSLATAMKTGALTIAEPVSVLVALAGRLRPFVNVRDAGLQLIKNGARELVLDVARRTGAPVVLEFGGPSTKLLSVPDRAALASLGTRMGAAAVLFPADEKTEAFLRDQRRSKAFRALAADGADYEGVINLDLATVDPMLLEAGGDVFPVRLLEGKPVGQVLLGGDSGATLRDLYTVGSLLKGKRSPGNIEFLFAPPSRQCLEVLARDGVLLDLIAMGARVVEPDRRVLTGECYPPTTHDLSIATFDPTDEGQSQRITASAETLAFALSHGQIGDPRAFRRQVRVALPRQLPTEDPLLLGATRRDGGARRGRQSDIDA
jgi:aconitate hydratase